MTTSLLCVHDCCADCQMPNCACACHRAKKEAILRSIDALSEQLTEVFEAPDLIDHPAVHTAMAFVRQAVDFYCSVPLTNAGAQALILAEMTLAHRITGDVEVFEVADDDE